MAYNPALYFPQQYQPFQQFQPVTYQPPMQPQTTQAVSRMVEIIPVDGEEAAAGWPVGVGSTQAMMAKDDSFIAFKTVSVNGQTEFTVYDRRPPKPPEPVFDPKDYVRRDEIEALILSAMKEKKEEKK